VRKIKGVKEIDYYIRKGTAVVVCNFIEPITLKHIKNLETLEPVKIEIKSRHKGWPFMTFKFSESVDLIEDGTTLKVKRGEGRMYEFSLDEEVLRNDKGKEKNH